MSSTTRTRPNLLCVRRLHPEHGCIACSSPLCPEVFRSDQDRDLHVLNATRRALYIAASRIKAASLSSSAFRRSSNTSRPSIPTNDGPAQLKNATRSPRPLAIGTVILGPDTKISDITNVQQGYAMRCSLTIWTHENSSQTEASSHADFSLPIRGLCKSQHALHLHQRSEHLKLEFPCPMEGCSKTLTSRLGIKQHVKAVHEGIGFPCHDEGRAKDSQFLVKLGKAYQKRTRSRHSSVPSSRLRIGLPF